jgi:hypothetical protein
MFARKKYDNPALDEAIENSVRWLDPNSDDYLKSVDVVERLYKLKEQETPKRMSPDTTAIVVGNLVGIFLILHYEQLHVVSSKALGFVLKLK